MFAAFISQIREHIGEHRHKLLLPNFSTTGPIERAASEVVLMGALKNAFDYEFHTLCGIPEIHLMGTPEDWKDLHMRGAVLCEQGLGWWWPALKPVLASFVDASEGRVDRTFWQSFFKANDDSGGPFITGWINALLPFLERDGQLIKNPDTLRWQSSMGDDFGGGPSHDVLPAPMTRAPVLWRYLEQKIELDFCAGFMGVECLPDGAVRPSLGWGVLRGQRPSPILKRGPFDRLTRSIKKLF